MESSTSGSSRAPQRKITAAGSAAGLGVAVVAVVNAFDPHLLTPAEGSAISGLLAVIAGYLVPG